MHLYDKGKTLTDLAEEMLDFFRYEEDDLPEQLDEDTAAHLAEMCGEKYLPDNWYKQLFSEIKKVGERTMIYDFDFSDEDKIVSLYESLIGYGIVLTKEMIDDSKKCDSKMCPIANALINASKNIVGEDVIWSVSPWTARPINSMGEGSRKYILMHPELNERIMKYDSDLGQMPTDIFEIDKFLYTSKKLLDICGFENDRQLPYSLKNMVSAYMLGDTDFYMLKSRD